MNWTDATLHAVAAAAIVVVAAIVSPWWVAGVTAAYFVAREAIQTKREFGRWLLSWQWSAQELLEAFAPAAFLGSAAAIIARAIS